MLTYQSCENVLWSRIKKGAVIVFMATVIGVAVYHIIIPGLKLIAAGAEKPNIEPAVLTGAERAEHYRLLRKHGLLGDVSAIEIGKNGQLFFYRDGKRCRFI